MTNKILSYHLTTGTHLQRQTHWFNCVLCLSDIREELSCRKPVPERMILAITVAELVTTEEARTDAVVAPVFVLAGLAALYSTRMEPLETSAEEN